MSKALLKIAGSFSSDDIDKITKGFEKLLGRQIDFEIVEDSSLIGGFAAYINGKVYDSTVALQLKNIRRGFLKD
ncbi:MAG: hypothetical protein GX107_03255 [Clostridiales bacterium]|jgi:F0F1-type ATP synthase delta subunit|nr:hypothetical protein [Clostridiales bacterium]